MHETTINCYIDKVLRVFPHISEYVALTNIWVTNDTLSAVDNHDELLNFYSISARQSEESISSLLKKGIPVFLHCDTYYLPYSKSFRKSHTYGHTILIESMNESNEYYVFDDVPIFEGYLSEEAIEELYENKVDEIRILKIMDSNVKRTKSEELEYMMRKLDADTINNDLLFHSMIDSDISRVDKLNVLKELDTLKNLKKYSAAYNGLMRIVLKLSHEYNKSEIQEIVNVVENYLASWLLVINMANKGIISNNEKFIDNIIARIQTLLEKEALVRHSIDKLKHTILPELIYG